MAQLESANLANEGPLSGATHCASCLLETMHRESRPRIPCGLLLSPEVVILGENIRLQTFIQTFIQTPRNAQ